MSIWHSFSWFMFYWGSTAKLTINSSFVIKRNFHGMLDFDWLWSSIAVMITVVTSDSKATITGKFYLTTNLEINFSVAWRLDTCHIYCQLCKNKLNISQSQNEVLVRQMGFQSENINLTLVYLSELLELFLLHFNI